MRVTNNMLINSMLYNINNNLEKMSHQQDMLASGKKVMKPSDDPVATSKILKYKTDIQEFEQYDSNTQDALAWLTTTETNIEDLGNIMQRLRELAVQGASDTTTIDDKQKIAEEVLQLKEQIINTGNGTFAGRYIFSGFDTDEKLFNEDGTFNIDITDYDLNNKPITIYEVGVGEKLEVSTNGLDIFGYVPLDNFFTQNIPTGEGIGTEATKSSISGNFDFTASYAAGAIDVTVNGTTYTTSAELNGTGFDIKKADLIETLRYADDGSGNYLKDVADIYFDAENRLVVKSRSYGADTLATTGLYTPTADVPTVPYTGLTTGAATITDATKIVTDAEVLAATETEEIFLALNGEETSITIDMSAINTVADYVTAVQAELDIVYPPAGTVVVAGSDGAPLTFSTSDTSNPGDAPELSVYVKKTSESQLLTDINEFITALNTGDTDAINNFIDEADYHLENLMTERANIGARTNRMELILNRISDNAINFTSLLSDAEDADMSEVIMHLKNTENVYKASLSAGARIIQPTLMDFLR